MSLKAKVVVTLLCIWVKASGDGNRILEPLQSGEMVQRNEGCASDRAGASQLPLATIKPQYTLKDFAGKRVRLNEFPGLVQLLIADADVSGIMPDDSGESDSDDCGASIVRFMHRIDSNRFNIECNPDDLAYHLADLMQRSPKDMFNSMLAAIKDGVERLQQYDERFKCPVITSQMRGLNLQASILGNMLDPEAKVLIEPRSTKSREIRISRHRITVKRGDSQVGDTQNKVVSGISIHRTDDTFYVSHTVPFAYFKKHMSKPKLRRF